MHRGTRSCLRSFHRFPKRFEPVRAYRSPSTTHRNTGEGFSLSGAAERRAGTASSKPAPGSMASRIHLTSSMFGLSLACMWRDQTSVLKEHGISPSAQRVAVAQYVLDTDEHPSAEEVWTRVRKRFPHVSRATVYNTLNLFVEKGLLRQLVLTEGRVVYDPKTDDHHHFIDEDSGKIHDVPWDAVKLSNAPKLEGFEVREYQVVMRGKRTRKRKKD